MLIIGCGNPDRGDDAAGALVARRLRELGVEARECSGAALDLIEGWDGSADVIVIDAVVSGREPGAISKWDAREIPLVRPLFRCSTHAFGVGEAIELARSLDRLPPRLTVYGIEGAEFDRGCEPSREVIGAVERLAQTIAAEQTLRAPASR